MKIDIQLFGVHERDEMIANLAAKLSLGTSQIHYDDRPSGGHCFYTAKKAWLAPLEEGTTHHLVCADDIEVCDNFLEIAEQIAEAHPKSVISFFPFEFMERNPEIEQCETPYFLCHVVSGCAIMMPVEYIEDYCNYVDKNFGENADDDWTLQFWAMKNHIQILTTVPSLVQHIGDVSVLNPTCKQRRTVYFEKNPEVDWSNQKIAKWCNSEWFFANHGKPYKNKGVLKYVEEL